MMDAWSIKEMMQCATLAGMKGDEKNVISISIAFY